MDFLKENFGNFLMIFYFSYELISSLFFGKSLEDNKVFFLFLSIFLIDFLVSFFIFFLSINQKALSKKARLLIIVVVFFLFVGNTYDIFLKYFTFLIILFYSINFPLYRFLIKRDFTQSKLALGTLISVLIVFLITFPIIIILEVNDIEISKYFLFLPIFLYFFLKIFIVHIFKKFFENSMKIFKGNTIE